MENPVSCSPHSLCINRGKNTVVTDVCEILSFDEGYVELGLSDCLLMIDGNELKIESFCNEKREVAISGYITSLSYSKHKSDVVSAGFLKRLFSGDS